MAGVAVEKKKKGGSRKKMIFVALLGFLILILVVLLGYFYLQYQRSQQLIKNPTAASQEQVDALIGKVGHLIALPENEQPTIATVSDVNKLKGQPFFKNAQNGFKLLVYTKAKKAILYDPFANKIVEVGPVNLGQTTAQAAVSPTPAMVKVVLYNGTNVVGLTKTIEKQLQSRLKNVAVVQKSNASRNDYHETIVADLTGKNGTSVAQIASTLNGQVGQLPAGEVKPAGVDILVILGN